MGQLFAAWGAQFDPYGGDACDQAQAQGLACLYQTGDREALKVLDRPAVLLLDTPVGETHVTVTAASGDTATLGSGAEARQVKWAELDPFWTENFLLSVATAGGHDRGGAAARRPQSHRTCGCASGSRPSRAGNCRSPAIPRFTTVACRRSCGASSC